MVCNIIAHHSGDYSFSLLHIYHLAIFVAKIMRKIADVSSHILMISDIVAINKLSAKHVWYWEWHAHSANGWYTLPNIPLKTKIIGIAITIPIAGIIAPKQIAVQTAKIDANFLLLRGSFPDAHNFRSAFTIFGSST